MAQERRGESRRGRVHAIFFVSGACGLIYQVLWVRRLGLIFGATTFAMATVLATFMGGLALGSGLAGRWSDRVRAPLKAYAALELAIAASAAAVLPALSLVDALQAAALPPSAPLAMAMAVQFTLCAAVLLVPTTAMGATLPLLSRWVSGALETRGRDLGRLYAVNTLGAFTGTVFAGFVAIELLGISATNTLAVLGNTAAAAGAWSLSRGDRPAPAEIAHVQGGGGIRSSGALLAMAAASGFLALAHEITWNRLVGLVLLNTTYAYTTILAVVIAGIGLGSLVGARLADATARPDRVFGGVQVLMGLAVLTTELLADQLVSRHAWLLNTQVLPFGQAQAVSVGLCAALLAPASLLMGAGYPLLAKAITAAGDVGRQVGRLYTFNTAGAIAGSVVAGFALLPWLGLVQSMSLLAAGNVVVGVLAASPSRGEAGPWRRRWAVLSLAAAGLVAAGSGRLDLRAMYQARLPAGSTILDIEEGATSTVMVADHSEPPVRRIWIQSCWVAGTGGGHKMLGHLSMLHSPARDRVVGIAFGTGQSFAAALLHGVGRLDCVDLNREMIQAGARWFKPWNGGLLERPETQVFIQDGRSFLARSPGTYDAVLMEPLQPWSAGAVNLYTREFYAIARRALRPGGTLTQWLPLDDNSADMTRSVVATMAAEFDSIWLYLDNFDLWIVGGAGDAPVALASWDARLSDNERVRSDLAGIDYPDVESVLATLVVGPADLERYIGAAPLLTDDAPFMEFVTPRTLNRSYFAENASAMVAALRAPLSGFIEDPTHPLPEALRDGSVARALALGNIAMDTQHPEEATALLAPVYARAPAIGRLRDAYREASWALAERQQRAGALDRAEETYRAHLRADPDFAGGRLNLGLLLARRGRAEQARAELEPLTDSPEVGAMARAALGSLTAP